MNKTVERIKFNLTPDMSLELIKFNELKKEYNTLKKEYENSIDKKNLAKLSKLEKEMSECKSRFVQEFRLNNQKQIREYLDKK